ncbi:NepR family anti-sigma factor [Sphingomonas sanguinis]|uniref:NepR family anti-sigma factor n=1 Tax=Sphingomonas sanguinis TaxID=33051 RepID=A0ABU5LRU5_9SPHN|nr:NepR family anti-sigma factor [Sphingomonas sanguinis]MDZ7282650.1 NepR family anti-sigma factor [Sphingomonas sanguinis]
MQGDILSLGNKTKKTPSSTPEKGGQKDAGSALRQAYQKTVDERIPDEMLDLLSKLD